MEDIKKEKYYKNQFKEYLFQLDKNGRLEVNDKETFLKTFILDKQIKNRSLLSKDEVMSVSAIETLNYIDRFESLDWGGLANKTNETEVKKFFSGLYKALRFRIGREKRPYSKPLDLQKNKKRYRLHLDFEHASLDIPILEGGGERSNQLIGLMGDNNSLVEKEDTQYFYDNEAVNFIRNPENRKEHLTKRMNKIYDNATVIDIGTQEGRKDLNVSLGNKLTTVPHKSLRDKVRRMNLPDKKVIYREAPLRKLKKKYIEYFDLLNSVSPEEEQYKLSKFLLNNWNCLENLMYDNLQTEYKIALTRLFKGKDAYLDRETLYRVTDLFNEELIKVSRNLIDIELRGDRTYKPVKSLTPTIFEYADAGVKVFKPLANGAFIPENILIEKKITKQKGEIIYEQKI